MAFDWTAEKEQQLLELKNDKKFPFKQIAEILGTTISSVKHKYQRLDQKANSDRHHHPAEKTGQILKYLWRNDLTILETHAGWGNLSKVYHQFGEVLAHEIDAEKVAHLETFGFEEFDVLKCDSEKEIFRYVLHGLWFDVIDVDPYGFPSRFFPHIFKLFKKEGLLFLTFPKMGVAQINKIMIRHYQAFWGIELEDKEVYIEKIVKRLKDFAFMEKKSLEVLDVLDLGKVYRFAIKVNHASMLDLVGLKVERR